MPRMCHSIRLSTSSTLIKFHLIRTWIQAWVINKQLNVRNFTAVLAALICMMTSEGRPDEGTALSAKEPEIANPEQLSIDEISRQLENPLSTLWSLTLQENYTVLAGDAISGSEWKNTLFFQPAFPISWGKNGDKVFIARPVFPYVSNPDFTTGTDGETFKRESGLGDIQVLALAGPNTSRGLVWGVGATFKFPTASDDALGQGKYQAGPAVMLLNIGQQWTTGLVAQHWWSYAGDSKYASTSQTDFQYIFRRSIPGGWSIGLGPTVTIDWKASSGEKVTFPIGLGVTKTVKWGKTPVKMRLEPQYSIIRPDDLGTTWNIRLQITPVINNPFSR